MKKLKDILTQVTYTVICGDLAQVVSGLYINAAEVSENGLFAAMHGERTDGHLFIPQAIERGAKVILCTNDVFPEKGVTILKVTDVAETLGLIAAAYYDFPTQNLTLIGITGTNGKTSTATMLYDAFRILGYKCGLISTVKYAIDGIDYHSTHTTPHVIRINELAAQMLQVGCTHVFMEVSSHALIQKRVFGLQFKGAVFTNLTHDHLDYHKTFKSYLYAKKLLFDALGPDAFALYNKDDKNGTVMVQNTKATRYTYSLLSASDFKIKVLEQDFAGMLVQLQGSEVWLQLVGRFNAYNILSVYGVAFLLEIAHDDIIRALSQLQAVNGRFAQVRVNAITAIIDYAHTPDALQNALDTLNALRTKNEKLFTVIGCGGDRDKEKRPVMANIAATNSDQVIFTSDNPRSEDPEIILDEMMRGVKPSDYKKTLRISQRDQAIKTAVSMCKDGDVILIAGKGHETYQEINGVKHHFDDKEVVIHYLNQIKS